MDLKSNVDFSIFDQMNFQHFLEMLKHNLQRFQKMLEIHCIKNARNQNLTFDLSWTYSIHTYIVSLLFLTRLIFSVLFWIPNILLQHGGMQFSYSLLLTISGLWLMRKICHTFGIVLKSTLYFKFFPNEFPWSMLVFNRGFAGIFCQT